MVNIERLCMPDGLYEYRHSPSIEEELKGSATQLAPTDWLASLFTRHRIEAQSSSEYLSQSTFYKYGRWDIPFDEGELEDCLDMDDEAVDPQKIFNGRIQQRFMDIFNDILHHFGFGASRRALATEPTADESDDIYLEYDDHFNPPDYSTRPDLIILGQDAKYLPQPLQSYTASMSINEEQRRELYRGCVAVGKVEREQRRGETDRKLEKAANCARCALCLSQLGLSTEPFTESVSNNNPVVASYTLFL